MALGSARSKWLRNSLWARRAPSACSADRCHGPTSLSSAEGSPWQGFTGETQPSAWRASGLGNPQRITSAVKDTSARSELFGAIPGSSCQDNSLGVFCLPYHRTIQQPPGVVSLFLLTTYPLPFLSFFLSPRWISPGERATPPDGGCNSHFGCETTVLEHPRVSFRDLLRLETSPDGHAGC